MGKIKREKNKKKKLSSLVLLLGLTVVMLAVSTYAWFTANKTVTISTLDVNVQTTSGLQISADGFVWKAVLANSDLTGANYIGSVNQLPAALNPVSTAGVVTAGRLEMFSGVVVDDSGDFALTSAALTDARGSIGNYIAFDVFLKTEAETSIYLTTASNVIAKTGSPDTGLKNASRVAFVLPYDTTDGKSVSVPSDSVLATIQSQVPTTSFIWEPNYDVHTQNAVIAASSIYNITTSTTGAAQISYDGVRAPIEGTVSDPAIKLGDANSTLHPTKFAPVTTSIATLSNELSYQYAFKLSAGVTKVRIYMWVEGQDVDCENNASGSDISFNVQFSTNATP